MSKSRSRFITWAITTLVFTYLVIVAGSVVRATGSGMGCPDWPKCFGHYIPPTQLDQLIFEEGKAFKKGYFIIWDEALWKAKKDLTAGAEINFDEWEKYTKHDYARFNVMHTWTEYVNRLSGALLGIVSMIMLVCSLGVRREDRALPWLSGLTVFLIGFEGWLGATVVESNLMPAKITTHMIVALVIVAVVVGSIARARSGAGVWHEVAGRVPAVVKGMLMAAIGVTLIQIVLGTQVREKVDELDKLWNGVARYQWVEQLGGLFVAHALLAYVVVAVNCFAVFLLWRMSGRWPVVRVGAMGILVLVGIEWVSGAAMAQFGIPAYIQPVHLVVATLMFGLQFHLWTKLRGSGEPEEAVAASEVIKNGAAS